MNTIHKLGLIVGVSAVAVDSANPAEATPRERNKFTARVGAVFNVKADFKTSTAVPEVGPPAGAATPRFYNDGLVGVDISANAGGKTWNWGYDTAAQYDPVAGTVAFHASGSPLDFVVRSDADRKHAGGELTYSREIGTLRLSNSSVIAYGFNFGFAYAGMEFRDDGLLLGSVTLTTDKYTIAPNIAPLPPFRGEFAGVNTPLSSDPGTLGRSVLRAPAFAEFSNKLDSSVYVLKLGPYVEVPLGKHCYLNLGGGLSAGLADMSYSFAEKWTVTGGVGGMRAGVTDRAAWLVGGHFSGRLGMRYSRQVDVSVGADFQTLGRTGIGRDGKTAALNLSEMITVSFGIGYSF